MRYGRYRSKNNKGGITETIHVLREGRKIGINRFGSERNNECCC
jgi:hypothetical protein